MSDESDVPVGQALEQAVQSGVPTGGNTAPEADADEAAVEAGPEINLDSLLDVPVTLSVEIGRTRLPIKQLISLNQGSVIELDREVNEPLDLLVNGTLMARGEVVVVDGQFGLRLVDIVSPRDRLRKLK